MSSTYMHVIKISPSLILTYRTCSCGHFVKLFSWKYLSIRLYHALNACFSPYSAFFSLRTLSSSPFTLYPNGCSIYTSSSRTPFKRANFTSIWWILHLCWATRECISLMVPRRAIGVNTSSYVFLPFVFEWYIFIIIIKLIFCYTFYI